METDKLLHSLRKFYSPQLCILFLFWCCCSEVHDRLNNSLKRKPLVAALDTVFHSTSKRTAAAAAGLRQRCSDERVRRKQSYASKSKSRSWGLICSCSSNHQKKKQLNERSPTKHCSFFLLLADMFSSHTNLSIKTCKHHLSCKNAITKWKWFSFQGFRI